MRSVSVGAAVVARLAASILLVGAGTAVVGADAVAVEEQRESVVVALGDSLLSGNAARWAGNSDAAEDVDALGPSAYEDEACLRSVAAPVSASEPLGFGDLAGVNLACKGATTTDLTAQISALGEVAQESDVELVVVAVGANDVDVPAVVTSCAATYSAPGASDVRECASQPHVAQRFDSETLDGVQGRVESSLRAIRRVLDDAGSNAEVVALTYPRLLPVDGMRYEDGGTNRTYAGRCPFLEADATFLNDVATASINEAIRAAAASTGAVLLDIEPLLAEHELCALSASRVGDADVQSWTDPGAAEASEWVRDFRLVDGPSMLAAESMQINYWGQRALRGCLRQTWNDGDETLGGTCVPDSGGVRRAGEPGVDLQEAPVVANGSVPGAPQGAAR